MMNYDAIVVGAGAIGGSIAFELASRGLKVVRVGETKRENAASMAAGAMNGCFGEITSGLVSSEYGRLKVDMDIKAKSGWENWSERLSEASGMHDDLLTAKGTHVILNSAGMAEVDTVNYETIEATLQRYNEPYETVSASNVPWIKANDLVRPMQALYIPAENAVNSHLLLEKLDAAFLGKGGEIINENAAEILTEADVATGVKLTDGTLISADNVVIAAGVHSLDLLDAYPEVKKRIPPMFAGYGVSILARLKPGHQVPDSVIRTPNRAFACGLHCVPREKDLLYIGATNILAESPRKNALISDVQFLLDCALDQLHLDLNDAEVEAIQVGNRPIPADGYPLIGQCHFKGLWLATGTYRDGLHQSPLLAAYMADKIQGRRPEINLDVFSPIRKPLPGLSREETVKETVKQMFATGYEFRWDIKPYWLPLLDKGMTGYYADLIESLHPSYTPPPELVAFSYLYRSMYDRLAEYYEAWS
ncbi:FAD-dependent oxidoreductase [Photobacterium sp. 2_MG-2023]|uniref:NAD(P)/FAD-dependent oxidoreductase n=1 Tax=Photobacterium TaxID=657 RepID=UPI0026E4021C|nr:MULTISPECIES: FAD-dependent oxidoreductase [Photobacterium]MDO6580434.1 FAD-dependent oxidoreductase [Photobacterium sp. 2_MG-2023]